MSTNRLAGETSPYLRQHADNPVDWYPWGPEAFEAARELDRPILLSIGYSACHWCHVMEKESFRDPDMAHLMNELFINVKVDREERPDVDQIYMRAVQTLRGQGGWPLTAVLTPDGRPFFGGTYFPPVARHGMPGFEDVLRATARAYRDQRDDVDRTATHLTESLARASALTSPEPRLDPDLLDDAFDRVADTFDRAHGGFGRAPKFPQPVVLDFLLGYYARTGHPDALDMVLATLDGMWRGGLNDQLGGGFHRYAVDERWLIPHFEKMLYDNALLARVYLDAWRHTGRADMRTAVERTLDWMLRDLGTSDGAFYSAWDADSEGEEGRYYLWTRDQIDALLGPDAEAFARTYDVSHAGNFEGRNILHLPRTVEQVAAALGSTVEDLEALLRRGRERLREARRERVAPALDTKVLTSWNGLALRALAEAGGAFSEPRYLRAGAACAEFLLSHVRKGDDLFRVWDGERARISAFLEDYAALGLGLLSLHAATSDPRWLHEVRWCVERTVTRFWHPGEGRLYDAAEDGETLIVRPREMQDSAVPSGNALAAELLIQAGRLWEEPAWTEIAERVLADLAPLASRHALGFGRLLSVVDLATHPAIEVALVSQPDTTPEPALVEAAMRRPLPGRLIAAGTPESAGAVSVLRDRPPVAAGTTAYVCRDHACSLPVTDPDALGALLDEARAG